MDPLSFKVKHPQTSRDDSVNFCLQLVGSLPVHPLTTTPVLPWIVAEIQQLSTQSLKEKSTQVQLSVSPTKLRCDPDTGKLRQWDPLVCFSLFAHSPQHVHKLIHNSHDPSYFACLIKDGAVNQHSICYVFKADDQTKVPEIISTIRQAGKIARQEEFQNNLADVEDPFSKKFEVLFCGRVTVAQKKAPPDLIDECIDKFNDVSDTKNLASSSYSRQRETGNHSGGFSISDKARSDFQPLVNDEQEKPPMRKSYSQPGLHSLSFKTDLQARSLRSSSFARSFDEGVSLNLRSWFIHGQNVVQPTDMAANRIMLFTIGQSEVYIISPDTKKVAIEKSFKEISFCSQGIRHVDHFGFICRESSENGGFLFVCYVFQCTDEALVDEIMLTLKQAFTVAAGQNTSPKQSHLCEECPMHTLHKLCEKIEGLHPSKTKIELQKHLTILNNQEQAAIFEKVQKIRPRNEQKENELIMSLLRNMCEEKQNSHKHLEEVKQPSTDAMDSETTGSTPRFRLEMLKSKAKRSLTDSLASILSRGSKSKGQLESSGSLDLDASLTTTLSVTSKETSLCEREDLLPPENPLKANGELSRDLESPPSDQHGTEAHPNVRRRANTLGHVPVESSEEASELTEASLSVPHRKLTRYHSVSTEMPHQQSDSVASSDPSADAPSPPLPPPSPPPARLKASASSPNFLKYLRQNSSGQPSGQHAVPKSPSYRSALRKKLHSSSSVPNFLKFLAPVDENNTSDFSHQKSDYMPKSSEQDSVYKRPMKIRRNSWRQQIFLRVATPQKGCDPASWQDDYSELGELSPRSLVCEDGASRTVKEERKRTSKELRELWHKAILQQILLLRMEKENQKLQASESNLLNKRLKLDYEEITPCLRDITLMWEEMLNIPGRSKMKFDMEKIQSAVGKGVPRHHRGEIWKFLSEQYHLLHQVPSKQQLKKEAPYQELLKQLTSQQHDILIDLGRTFPTHPYFSAQLGAGQLSLYNILKAYSLMDQEVGYCQGLSFVAGVLLLHMSEEEAFKMLRFLMFEMGLRKQYQPNMTILQIQMYQLSRLLHDYHRDLYDHLEAHDIGPTLYAAPWFLTMFASQFPLGFVTRVFDMLFLQGFEVIFKVALSMLGSHKPLILQHKTLEAIIDFIKCTLPNVGLAQMEKTINQVLEMDITKQLLAYEVEYHVLQDELIDSSLSDNQRMDKLEKANSSLRKQNVELLEDLQVARGKIQNLEARIETLLNNESELKQTILSLGLERKTSMEKPHATKRKPLFTRDEHVDVFY